MAKTNGRRSDRATSDKKESRNSQKNLSDGDGEIITNDKFPEVDRALKKFLHARDQKAAWEVDVQDARKAADEALQKRKHVGKPYFYDYGGTKYKVTVAKKDSFSCEAVKERTTAKVTKA